VAINHSFVPALYQRAAAYVARGELSAADGDMRAVLAVSADNMMAQISRAQIATQSGEKEKAEILLKQAVAAHPQEPLPSLVLSSFDMQQGRFDDAAGVISDFLNKVPGNPNAIAMRGQIELAAGKPDQAVTTFRQLAATYPKLPQIQMLLATALTKMGKTKEALSAYQQAVELAPMMQAAHVGLIQLALANKDEAGALAAAQDYAEKQPGPVSADTLARTYASLNRISDAIDVLTRSQAKYPDGTTIVALTTLLRKQGEIKKADAMLADWIAKHPNDVGRTHGLCRRAVADRPGGRSGAVRGGAEIPAV
jgi:predicted Zn-dependent protease